MAITRATSSGWLQDLDAATISRASSTGWVELTSSDVVALPGSGALTVTASAPDVSVFVEPGAANITVTGEVSSLFIDEGSRALSPGAATLTVSAEAPSISIGALGQPAVASAVATGSEPTLGLTDHHVAFAGAGSLGITSLVPLSLVVEPTIISPDAGTLTLDESATNAVQNEQPSPGAATVAVTGYQVTLQRLFASTPPPDTLEVTGSAPSLIESVATIAQPAAAQVQASGQDPVAAIGIVEAPGDVVLRATGEAPALRLDLVCSPEAGALSVAGSAPAMAQVTNVVRQPDSVYARPIGSILNTWLPNGAPTTYEAIDEVHPDDSDYMYVAAAAGQQELLRLSPLDDPGFHTGHTLRYRVWGTAMDYMVVTLATGAGTDITPISFSLLPTSPTEYEVTLTEAQAAAITDYGDLAVKFWTAYTGAPVYASWATLEISGVTEALSVNSESPSVAVTDLVIVGPAPASLSIEGQPVAIGQQHRPSPAPAVLVASATAPVAAHGAQVAAGSVEVAGEAPVVEVGTVLRIEGSPPSIGWAVAAGLGIDDVLVRASVVAIIEAAPAVGGIADVKF